MLNMCVFELVAQLGTDDDITIYSKKLRKFANDGTNKADMHINFFASAKALAGKVRRAKLFDTCGGWR